LSDRYRYLGRLYQELPATTGEGDYEESEDDGKLEKDGESGDEE